MNAIIKRTAKASLPVALLLASAAVAMASEAGGHGGEAHGNDWLNFSFRVATFAIVAGILYKAAGKKIGDYLKTRRFNIENDLSDMETRKKEAEARLADVEKRIKNLDAERQAILDEYTAQGEALKAAILEKAEKNAAQIKENAKNTAAIESRLAVEQIRAEVADMVVEAAEKLLTEKLTKEEHEKLIDKYLTKVVFN